MNSTNYNGNAGGIVGYEHDDILVENCYNIGAITLTKAVGKAVTYASASESNVTNCYYNTETCLVSDNVATGYTTSQMKAATFITALGSSFAADTNNINNGYPVLSWQNQ